MSFYYEGMREYWDGRFSAGRRIWGSHPSRSAVHALEMFRRNQIRSVFVPGSGYGRNSRLFSEAGLRVVGVEVSGVAVEMARGFDPEGTFHNTSILDLDHIEESFDGVYCFNLLHLFRMAERAAVVRFLVARTKPGGILYTVVFSEREKSFGRGREVEENTFESKPGRPVHYFSEGDLLDHFTGFSLIETGLVEDEENHGEEGWHVHTLRFIACANTSNGESSQ